MNPCDQRLIEICTAAVVRGGTPEPAARIIALQTAAQAFEQRGRAMAERADHAPRNQYHQERQEAGKILLRGRAFLTEIQRLQEAQ